MNDVFQRHLYEMEKFSAERKNYKKKIWINIHRMWSSNWIVWITGELNDMKEMVNIKNCFNFASTSASCLGPFSFRHLAWKDFKNEKNFLTSLISSSYSRVMTTFSFRPFVSIFARIFFFLFQSRWVRWSPFIFLSHFLSKTFDKLCSIVEEMR